MIYISHRGNIDGPNKEKENSPEYIMEASSHGFKVEIDVWLINNTFFLGHDKPTYEITESFLEYEFLWCHAKNIQALDVMLCNSNIHCFWHEEDTVTLTSEKFIWTYPGRELAKYGAIAVVPERALEWNFSNASGVCSDYINYIREGKPWNHLIINK